MRDMYLVLVGVLVSACGIFTAPEERLDLTVHVTASELVRGDTLTIQVRAYNRTSDTLAFQTGGCPLVFEALNDAGEVAAPEGIVCTQPLIPWNLHPGDSLAADYPWYGERWRNWSGPEFPPPDLLPAGRYRVYGILQTIDERERSSAVEVELRDQQAE